MPTKIEMPDKLAQDPTVALRRLILDAGREERTYRAEFRAQEADAEGDTPAGWTVNGYATVFDYEYPIWGGSEQGGWDETMTKGAVSKTLAENPDVVFLINHEGMPLARTAHGDKPGTLSLSADTSGLKTLASLDGRSQRARELAIAMERGDMDEMSMAFWVLRDAWLTADGEEVPWWDLSGVKRVIKEIKLHKGDVSVVNYGANDATSADVSQRALMEMRTASRLWSPAQRDELRALLGDKPIVPPVVEPPAKPAARGLDLATAKALAGL